MCPWLRVLATRLPREHTLYTRMPKDHLHVVHGSEVSAQGTACSGCNSHIALDRVSLALHILWGHVFQVMCSVGDRVIVALHGHTKAANLGLQVSREEHDTCGQIAVGDAKVAEEGHPSAHLQYDVQQAACSVRSVAALQCPGCKLSVPGWNGTQLQASQEVVHSATGHEFDAQEEGAGSRAASIEL